MKALSRIYIALIFTLLYIPILVLILFSFNSTGNTGGFTGFSLYWYRELFSSPATFTALKNTLVLAVSAAVISTLIGTAAAVGIGKFKNRAVKGTVLSLTNVPMMNPDIVTGISMMLLFVFVGTLLNSEENRGFCSLTNRLKRRQWTWAVRRLNHFSRRSFRALCPELCRDLLWRSHFRLTIS